MKKNKFLVLLSTFTVTLSSGISLAKDLPAFDTEGHRGARGLLPENSIPAFKKALDLGVTTLEMDTIITKDKKVIVSHDPYFSHEICLTPDGKQITEKTQKNFNIYKMNYADVLKYDCGSKTHPRFPKQNHMKVTKPLLRDVILESEKYIKSKNLKPVFYNIETKTEENGDKVFNPEPKEFMTLIYNQLKDLKILDRVIIQSFDVRTLQELKNIDPKIKTSLLVENKESFQKNIDKLGFNPDIYSPEYILVNKELIQTAHKKNIKVVPWTVNKKEEIETLKKLGVDGIISDYPNLFN